MPSSPLPGWVPVALAGLIGVVLLYVVLVGSLYALQRHMIFRPSEGPPLLERVGQPGLAEIRVRTEDGLELMAWHLPGREGAPVVLYLHGNGGHVGPRAERVRRIGAMGWGALFVGYRGYGGNPGRADEAGLRRDAAAGLAALQARGVAVQDILVWGESLGSGLATELAARHRFGAVVLESPYTSLADIARRQYPFVPINLLLRYRFDSLVHASAIESPVIVLVGERDRTVPPDMGRTILAALRGPAELWSAAEGGHNDLVHFGAMEAVAAFVARHRGG